MTVTVTVASRAWKRGHDQVVKALGAILDMSGVPFTTKQAQIPRQFECCDILVQAQSRSLSRDIYFSAQVHKRGRDRDNTTRRGYGI